jgi:hypothetical protein
VKPERTKANRATTIRTSGEHLVFRRLSFANNGDAQSFNAAAHAAPASLVELCHFESQLAIQDDGSFVEGGGTVSTHYRRNWCTNTGKAGLRWDGTIIPTIPTIQHTLYTLYTILIHVLHQATILAQAPWLVG